jgi:hypothetical protein
MGAMEIVYDPSMTDKTPDPISPSHVLDRTGPRGYLRQVYRD